jgi:hypothetical protein
MEFNTKYKVKNIMKQSFVFFMVQVPFFLTLPSDPLPDVSGRGMKEVD